MKVANRIADKHNVFHRTRVTCAEYLSVVPSSVIERGNLLLILMCGAALDKLRAAAVAMKKAHTDTETVWRTAGATLSKYIGNVVASPGEDKYR
jgi:hypothetical protein